MKGEIVIRGLSDEEIRENSGADDDYNAGFEVRTACHVHRFERVDILAAVAKGMHMEPLDVLAAAAVLAAGDDVERPWSPKQKQVHVEFKDLRREG